MRFLFCVGVMTFTSYAWADELEEIKTMMEQMKGDYEAKIQELESKIEALSEKQQKDSAKVEELTTQQDQRVSKIEEKVEKGIVNVEYVGRGKAPVGRGGLVVDNPFGFGSVSLGGYFDTSYRDFENTDSTFRQHRWIINIGAELHERLRFNSELEIEYGGPQSAGSDGEIKVEQAYGDYLINEAVNLRLGALLVPFGRYNLYHDSDLQNLTDRPIVARDIIPTTWTEAGAGFFGEFNPTIGSYEDLRLAYEIYAVNGLDAGFSDTGLSGAKNSLKTDNNEGKSVVGRLTISPLFGHEVGFSGYRGEYNAASNNITGGGFDWLSTWGPVEFTGDYAYFDVEEPVGSDLANFFQGGYAQVNYDFWPTFLNNTFLGRGFQYPTLTLVGQVDWALIADDSDAGAGDNEEKRWTLGFNYRPVPSFAFKFEYQWNEATNEALEQGDNNGFVTSVAMGF